MRVVLMRMRQVPTRKVAEDYGISERQVRRIMERWRKSPLRRDTEGGVEAVEKALLTIRDDMVALGKAAAEAPPEARVAIQAARTYQLVRNFSVLRDAGVTFEALYKERAEERTKDLGLVIDVNQAFRKTLDEHGVDPKATFAAIDAGMKAFAKWGYVEPRADVPLEDLLPVDSLADVVGHAASGGGHDS